MYVRMNACDAHMPNNCSNDRIFRMKTMILYVRKNVVAKVHSFEVEKLLDDVFNCIKENVNKST